MNIPNILYPFFSEENNDTTTSGDLSESDDDHIDSADGLQQVGDDTHLSTVEDDANAHEMASNERDPQAKQQEYNFTNMQLISQVLPNADVCSPSLVLMGEQNSGKSSLFRRIFLHYADDIESFTDSMGEKLLPFFKTGMNVMTPRPIVLELMKNVDTSGRPIDQCDITLTFCGSHVKLSEDEAGFDNILNRIVEKDSGNAFDQEVKIVIAAPDLPNLRVTDLPGLKTGTSFAAFSCPSSEQAHSPREVTKRYAQDKNNTLVVVEPALIEDFETSHISPLLREVKKDRNDVFDHSVLVLSKCDKIREDYGRQIMEVIDRKPDLGGRDFNSFPYKCVVGVINKVEEQERLYTTEETSPESFADLREEYRRILKFEQARFNDFTQAEGSLIDTKTQCTIAAVLNAIDHIAFHMLKISLEQNQSKMKKMEKKIQNKIRQQLAPPLWYYLEKSLNDPSLWYKPLLEEMEGSVKNLLDKSLQDVARQLIATTNVHCHEAKSSRCTNVASTLHLKWPPFQLLNRKVEDERSAAFDVVEQYLSNTFIEHVLIRTLKFYIDDAAKKCFFTEDDRIFTFHRIDRFPNLCEEMHSKIIEALPVFATAANERVQLELRKEKDFVQLHDMDQNSFVKMFEKLCHLASMEMCRNILKIVSIVGENLQSCGSLLQESHDFSNRRERMTMKWQQINYQHGILLQCRNARSAEELREVLSTSMHHSLANNNTGSSCTPALSYSCDRNNSNAHIQGAQMKMNDVDHNEHNQEHQYWFDFWQNAENEFCVRNKQPNEEARRQIHDKREGEWTREISTVNCDCDMDDQFYECCDTTEFSTRNYSALSAAPEHQSRRTHSCQGRLTATRKGTKRGMAVSSCSDNRSKKRSRRQITENTYIQLSPSSSSSHEFDSAVEDGPLEKLLRKALPEDEEYWAPLVSELPQEDRKEIGKCLVKYGKHLYPLILINLKLNLANKDKQPLQKGLLRFKPLYDMVKQKMHSLNDLEHTLIIVASSKRMYERLLTDEIIEAAAHGLEDEGGDESDDEEFDELDVESDDDVEE